MQDIDQIVKNASKLTDVIYEFYKGTLSYEQILNLEAELTLIKMMIGINVYDELPFFERALREVSKNLNERNK